MEFVSTVCYKGIVRIGSKSKQETDIHEKKGISA